MKYKISLKLSVILFFVTLTVAEVIGYSMLSAHFYVRGMDNIVTSDMVQIVDTYLKSTPADKRAYPAMVNSYFITKEWSTMPHAILEALPEEPQENSELVKIDNSGWLSPPDLLTFAMRHDAYGETLFIANQTRRALVPSISGKNAAKSLHILLAISLVTCGILGLVIWFSLQQVAKPVTAMRNWAHALRPEILQDDPPDFSYPELNELAQLIRNSLVSVQESLDREHRFLRHASHELRTPIAVIRNNVELMRRLPLMLTDNKLDVQNKVIDRIDRASLTMQHLTETLLWLSRESGEPPRTTPLDLEACIRSLVKELHYLVLNKNLDIEINTEPYMVDLPVVPTRIVLGNLIRNAFQHTWNGRIVISQDKDYVTIVNEQRTPLQGSEDLGFGLGLQLTAQLTAKLGWQYQNTAGDNGHNVAIRFTRNLRLAAESSNTDGLPDPVYEKT